MMNLNLSHAPGYDLQSAKGLPLREQKTAKGKHSFAI